MRITWFTLSKLEYLSDEGVFRWAGTNRLFYQPECPCLNCKQEFLAEVGDPYPVSRFYCSPRCMELHAPYISAILDYLEAVGRGSDVFPLIYLKQKGKPTEAVVKAMKDIKAAFD